MEKSFKELLKRPAAFLRGLFFFLRLFSASLFCAAADKTPPFFEGKGIGDLFLSKI